MAFFFGADMSSHELSLEEMTREELESLVKELREDIVSTRGFRGGAVSVPSRDVLEKAFLDARYRATNAGSETPVKAGLDALFDLLKQPAVLASLPIVEQVSRADDRRGLPDGLPIETRGPNVFKSVGELEHTLSGWERAGWSLGHIAQDLMVYHLTDNLPTAQVSGVEEALLKNLGDFSLQYLPPTNDASEIWRLYNPWIEGDAITNDYFTLDELKQALARLGVGK